MNKVLLGLPSIMLQKYVLTHFSELTVEEFLIVIEKGINIPRDYFAKNIELIKSPRVLMRMIDKDIEVYTYFSKSAFTPECIDKIISKGESTILFSIIDKYPDLLDDIDICVIIAKYYAKEMIMKMSSDQITDEVISLLESYYYAPDENDIKKSKLFLKSNILVKNAIYRNPDVILYIDKDDLTDEIVNLALRRGFVPKKEHFYGNTRHLREYSYLLRKAFEVDQSVIVVFPMDFIQKNINFIRSYDYVVSESDLIENPNLTHFNEIMENAIENNPDLILYVAEDCYIKHSVIEKALTHCQITKEKLKAHPNITKNEYIMNSFPEFALYSRFVTNDQRLTAIEDCLKNKHKLDMDDLPFFDPMFGSLVDINKLNELLGYLKLSIDENDIDFQEEYLSILDKVVDAISVIRYAKNKANFKYVDVVSMNNELNSLFASGDSSLSEYINRLYDFVGGRIALSEIKKQIDLFYQSYTSHGGLVLLSETASFFEEILNNHKDYYISNEKKNIFDDITSKLKLTEKKRKIIIKGKKLKIIGKIISEKRFKNLGITLDEFSLEIYKLKEDILSNKKIIQKEGVIITSEQLRDMVSLFMHSGTLTISDIQDILKIDNKKVLNWISQRFEKIKLKYIDRITDTDDFILSKSDKCMAGGINQNNYVICDNDIYIKNLSELVNALDEKTLEKILKHKGLIREIAYFLPIINLIPEFNIDTFINILAEYYRAKPKILSAYSGKLTENNAILLNRLADLINLSNAYASIDDIDLYALGKKFISKVGETVAPIYLKTYHQMIQRSDSYIPPVSLDTDDAHFESGVHADSERLLIGKIYSNSCIELNNPAGRGAYKEMLCGSSGDVILVRNKKNELISRIFLFRRGNVIQMVTRACEVMNSELKLITLEACKKIATQIIQSAIKNGDNIDYVILNKQSLSGKLKDTRIVKDIRIIDSFPHADLTDEAYVLCSKKEIQGLDETELTIDFKAQPQAKYKQTRKPISYQPSAEDITQLRALRITMENDAILKEKLAHDFEPFYLEEYSMVVSGEDWYIAIKKDGSVEELVLPSFSHYTIIEMEKVKRELKINSNKGVKK